PPAVAAAGQGDAVFGIGQHLSEGADGHDPAAGTVQVGLQLGPHAGGVHSPRPGLARGAALEAVAAHEVAVRLGDVAVAGHVDARRAPAGVVAVVEAGNLAGGAHAADVVHQVAAHLIASVGQAARIRLGHGVQQDLGRVD